MKIPRNSETNIFKLKIPLFLLSLIFNMSDVQIWQRPFSHVFAPDCPGTSCWDDWSHNRPWLCPQTRHFSGYEQPICLEEVVVLLGHYHAQHWSSRVRVHLRQVWAQCRKMKVVALTDIFLGRWPGHLKRGHIGEGLKWQRKDPGTNEGRAWYVYKFLLQPLALVCSMRNVDILLRTRIWNDLPP